MGKIAKYVIGGIVIIGIGYLSYLGSRYSYNEGHQTGAEEGYTLGYSKGFENGNRSGIEAGIKQAINEMKEGTPELERLLQDVPDDLSSRERIAMRIEEHLENIGADNFSIYTLFQNGVVTASEGGYNGVHFIDPLNGQMLSDGYQQINMAGDALVGRDSKDLKWYFISLDDGRKLTRGYSQITPIAEGFTARDGDIKFILDPKGRLISQEKK